MQHVVSFSGGRTSAYLAWLIKQRYPDAKFVFMDTGAEHPKTYEFIREVDKRFDLNLTCLRTVVYPTMGDGCSFREVTLDECVYDVGAWRDMVRKYTCPSVVGRAFCTDRMKVTPFTKWIKQNVKFDFTVWIGIRADEPKRLKERPNTKYLAEISDFGKDDVVAWWATQPFDLQISHEFGNCVFCLKKGLSRLRMVAQREPLLAQKFLDMLQETNDGGTPIFRGNTSFQDLINGNTAQSCNETENIDVTGWCCDTDS